MEDSGLRGGGFALKKKIWDAARDTIQAWTGEELTECSLYGIRVYKENAILATHVDRLPLVSSAIINVASDLDEPWPLEVYGHDGKATNVTMEPGDMVRRALIEFGTINYCFDFWYSSNSTQISLLLFLLVLRFSTSPIRSFMVVPFHSKAAS